MRQDEASTIPFPLFEVNAAQRSMATLNQVVPSKLIGMYEHIKRH